MQVSEHLHILKIPFQVPISPELKLDRFVNVLLVYGESEVILVDSGVAGAEEIIFSYLTATGRSPAEVKRMILSHSHPDHLGAARTIKKKTGCRIHAHPAERPWIEDTARQYKERPVPGFNQLVGGSVPVAVLLENGDRIKIDRDVALEVIHTPGHSPGSISLHFPAYSAVFTGDAIPVPHDLPIFTDWHQSSDSINRIKALPKTKLLLSSWAGPAEDGGKDEAIAAGLDWLRKIKDAVDEVAGRNLPDQDPLELCRIVCAKLALPPAAVNPLVAKSFASCLQTSTGNGR
jgi:glyoxylase-like metal-dependent hydrolase (beta-lactamase superfamily II)